MKSFNIIISLFIVALLGFSACDKPEEPDEQTAKDMAKGAYIVSDAFAVSNDYSNSKKGISEYPDCITTGVIEGGISLTFDNCTFNGITRNGVLEITYNGPWSETGSTLTIGFVDYTVDGHTMSGSITSEHKSEDASGIRSFTITASDMELTFSDGNTTTWDSERNYRMIAGLLTFLDPTDNVFEISGSSTGVNRKGESYTTSSTQLRKDFSCKFPVSGTTTITKGEDSPIEIDFDTDNCLSAKVTQNGITIEIDL
ncbi:MAG: hypothetical protein U9N85_00870 [Bacteroidota bacterium]|nr:hypothetical protein [Bacteroidota bacterium]